MNNEDDPFDPEVEDFMDYMRRQMLAGQSRSRRPRPDEAPDKSIAPPSDATSSDATMSSAIQIAPPQVVRGGDVLHMLIHMVQQAASVDEHCNNLRSVANWLNDEADRLQARDPINYHVSPQKH